VERSVDHDAVKKRGLSWSDHFAFDYILGAPEGQGHGQEIPGGRSRMEESRMKKTKSKKFSACPISQKKEKTQVTIG